MRPVIGGITNPPNIFVAYFGHEICLKPLSMQQYLRLSTTATRMGLNLKHYFLRYRFFYLHKYLILCFVKVKPLKNLLKTLSIPVGI